jgi:hypothetical protein
MDHEVLCEKFLYNDCGGVVFWKAWFASGFHGGRNGKMETELQCKNVRWNQSINNIRDRSS